MTERLITLMHTRPGPFRRCRTPDRIHEAAGVWSRGTVIQPSTAEAAIRFDIGCNHHGICYCAMLDYEETDKATIPVPAGEEGSKKCILGAETGERTIAKEIVGFPRRGGAGLANASIRLRCAGDENN